MNAYDINEINYKVCMKMSMIHTKKGEDGEAVGSGRVRLHTSKRKREILYVFEAAVCNKKK